MTTESFADHATKEPNEKPADNQDDGIKIGDRTFNSLEDLSKSWESSQAHIKTIESENAQFKTDLSKAKELEDVIEELKNDAATRDSQTESAEAAKTGYLTEDGLNNVLAQRELQQAGDANLATAMNTAKESLGDGFIEKLEGKAKELGMSEDEAMTLARKSPQAFSKLFVPEAPSANANSFGDINATAITPPQERADSARVEVGAKGSDVLKAWNAAAPQT